MGTFSRADRRTAIDDLSWIPEIFPRVAERIDQQAGTLSGAEQQMLAMARALMGRPRLICMDEPTMGLSPLYVDRVLKLIADMTDVPPSIFGCLNKGNGMEIFVPKM